MSQNESRFISDTTVGNITCLGITHSNWGQNLATQKWTFLQISMTLPSVFSIKPCKNLCIEKYLGENKMYWRYLFFISRVKKKNEDDKEIIHMWITDSCGYQYLDTNPHATERK